LQISAFSVKLIKGNMDLISICSIHLKFKDEVYFIYMLNMIFFFFLCTTYPGCGSVVPSKPCKGLH